MILARQMTAVRRAVGGLTRRPRGGVQRANEPHAAMAQAGDGTGLTTEQIKEWFSKLGQTTDTGPGGYYRTSVPVYRAVKLRSDAVARARLKVYRLNRDGEQEWVGEADPVQGLFDRVNQDWTRSRMWRAVETYLCLWGQSFRWVNRAESPDPSAWEIWPLRPDKVKVVVGKDGTIAGYIHDPTGSRFAMLPDEVIWDRYFNPLDHHKGQSPLLAGLRSVQMQLEMLEFNSQLFKSGLLVSNLAFFLDALTDDTDIALFHERIADRYSGVGNAQRPLVVKGPGSVQNLGISNRDMEFIQGIQLAKEHVADIYGVPEELMAGAQHPTFSNREAAIRDFYANTVTQEWDLLASEMQEQFVPMLPRAYRDVVLRFDTEEIAEMQESLSDRSNREVTQATGARTKAEAVNVALQAGLVDESEGRVILSGDPIFGDLDALEQD